MAVLNLKYYGEKDVYSDGNIEDIILQMVKEGIGYENLPQDQVEFPMIYHLSEIRGNILRWYPMKKDATVLEIGSGCGAITGTLCDKAGMVVSVELSKRRAQINYERNKNRENLCIMVGNLNDMVFPEKFDYVVVNGVLEYAMSFTEGDTPYESFLRNMGKFLKKSGKIMIAIENRLGLKYFAGAPEDHTDLYFYGLNGYPHNDSVRTFSKKELTELLKRSTFSFMKFYYPYPDYKFPSEIFTDESLYKQDYGNGYPVYTDKSLSLFSEEEVVKSFSEEKILDRFVNSFLVVASRKPFEEEEKIQYVKMNQERNKKFRLMTLIEDENGKKVVKKRAMHREADATVKNLIELGKQEATGKYKNLECKADGDGIVYPFLKGITLQHKIEKWAEEKNGKAIKEALWDVYENIFCERRVVKNYQTEEFVKTFGSYPGKEYYECIQPANVDLICSNLIEVDEGYQIIDYEWIFPFMVPVSFIMWRMLHELYTRIPELYLVVSQEKLQREFGIEYSDCEIFLHWTMHFVYQYVGSDSLTVYHKTRIKLPIKDLVQEKLARNYIDTKLYYDDGNGLNEEHTISKRVEIKNNRFEISLDLSEVKNIQGIRWNWNVGTYTKVQIDNVECNCRIRLLTWDPRVEGEDSRTCFLTPEITYYIDAWDPSSVQSITVQGRIWHLEKKEAESIISEEYFKAKEKEKNLDKQLYDARMKINMLKEQPVEIAETTEAKEAKIIKFKRKIKHLLGRTEIPQEVSLEEPIISTTCVGNIDSFSYENGVLHTIGWAFDTVHEMKKKRITFYHQGEKVEETSFSVIPREDVAEVLGISKAKNSGFTVFAVVETPVPLEIYLEYDKEEGEDRFLLGKIPGAEDKSMIQVFPITSETSIGYIQHFCENRVISGEMTEPLPISPQTIDIIIPIYNGMEYFDTLFAGIEKTRMKYRLILVDDKSPDPEVLKYLERYAQQNENVVLIKNEENVGFVRSVNRALEIAVNHVALVNTDVEVPEEWLERLMEPILQDTKIATSTPFTTCGTLCSFPEFCKDNKIFEGMPLWKIDDAFRRIKPMYPTMPTGVGFCMGMNIDAIRKVGYLDAETFGKGYGEENDWCRRAVEAGYRNVQVENLYVYHKHGGSFPSEEKQKLLEHNLKELERKHPNYNRETAAFCRRDPAREVRLYVMMQLLNQYVNVPTIVAFDHILGGGATEYLIEKKKAELKKGKRFITIRFDINNTRYLFNYEYRKYQIEFWARDLEEVFANILRVDEIWINELVTYPDLYQVLEKIVNFKEKHHAHLKMLLHDFFSICPAVNLMDEKGEYCKAAESKRCDECIPANRSNACLDYETGTLWREHWGEFLLKCDEVLAFSDDTGRIFKKIYPGISRMKVVPHKPHYVLPLDKKNKTTKSFQIGLLGVLCYKKGLEVVKNLVKYIEKNQLDIKIKLIGISDEEIDSPVFSCTGRYSRGQLPWLTMKEDIDMFLIPSIWPETFSYTTSEIISMNMPIAVFPIGAPVDRVINYERGLILSTDEPEIILKEMTEFAEKKLPWMQKAERKERILFVGEEISFASRYRVEHFREQLFYHGYESDFIQMSERNDICLENYTKLVFYRCSCIEGVKELVQKSREQKIPVYYDIDDFIFDYDKIDYLTFLKGSEYVNFRETTERIHACMELCDGYFTSTKTLSKEIEKEFPGKKVIINRNCASMEMQILSHDAVEETEKHEEKVYIGYFSGSKTHNEDFEIIEDVLEKLMKKYPNVYLKLVGVLSEDKMNRMQNRIEKLPFMEWQKLPGVIAGIDINLMPLEDSVFHCCKSENKWMEAALVKVPSVMSRNKEMEAVIENGKTAWLCSEKEEWYQALESLITDEKARREMGENAHQVVMESYVTQKTGKDAREELVCSEVYTK